MARIGGGAGPACQTRADMSVEITDERVAAAAAKLHEGGWFYSAKQLYYAACADVETPPTRVASGEVGVGVLLILIGAITGQRILLEVLGIIGLVFVIVGAVTHVQERRPLPVARLLAISYPDFERRFIDGGREYPGLIVAAALAERSSAAEPLVVCDRAETAAVMQANRAALGNAAVIVASELPADVASRRVVTLHDCDPVGCALPADLRDRGAVVSEAGINPVELAGRRLQIIEGAPARLPRDLSGHLDTAQTDWLRGGRRLECATESPEQLVQRVQEALARADVS
jgi:hypothetical protein